MNLYYRKQVWKIGLLILATVAGALMLLYTHGLIKDLALEERNRVELWAEATRELTIASEKDGDFSFILRVIQENETIPVIVTNEKGEILHHRNLKPNEIDTAFMQRQLKKMKSQNPPIELQITEGQSQFIYWGDSIFLKQLIYYPVFQMAVVLLFIFISYLAFSESRKAEQNQVWVGLSKETAHQLATPTSSLMALAELLKEQRAGIMAVNELEKDIRRLEKITDRFSKIGSKPALENTNLVEVIYQGIDYIKKRVSEEIDIQLFTPKEEIMVPLNVSLFDWVIENLCKNAIDSVGGAGKIDIVISDYRKMVHINVSDNGKGIPRNLFKTIFKPGFTTKNKGWGLGLSLSKRIIEIYHRGKIFVLNSEPHINTTLRIILYK